MRVLIGECCSILLRSQVSYRGHSPSNLVTLEQYNFFRFKSEPLKNIRPGLSRGLQVKMDGGFERVFSTIQLFRGASAL
jgi:hypothetical protein